MLVIPSTTPIGDSVCQIITIFGDDLHESNETFSVEFNVVDNDVIDEDSAALTILDDDGWLCIRSQIPTLTLLTCAK